MIFDLFIENLPTLHLRLYLSLGLISLTILSRI